MRIPAIFLLSLLALMACSKPESTQGPGSEAPPRGVTPPLVQQVAGAATTPLNDLNLVHAKIPPVLIAAQRAPYAPPADATCAGLVAEIRWLNEALGEDLDAPRSNHGPTLFERGRTDVTDAAVGTVRSTAEALIPYRSWVRRLTGAERFSKQVSGAIAAGIVRRAYLKGLGQAQGCQAPAAPLVQGKALEGPVLIEPANEPIPL